MGHQVPRRRENERHSSSSAAKTKKQTLILGFPIGGTFPAWRKRTNVTFCSVRNPPGGWLWGCCGTRVPCRPHMHPLGGNNVLGESACFHFRLNLNLWVIYHPTPPPNTSANGRAPFRFPGPARFRNPAAGLLPIAPQTLSKNFFKK